MPTGADERHQIQATCLVNIETAFRAKAL
jgi:hypothetical protein